QIVFHTRDPGLAWVKVGGETVSEDDNGNIRSDKTAHKIFVEKELLEKAGGYTVRFTRCLQRKPYFPETGESFEKSYSFRPVEKRDGVRLFMLCDSHSMIDGPVKTGGFFRDGFDALILNGDIPDHSGTFEHLLTIPAITSPLTRGEIPVICARGNHDARGEAALAFSDFVATDEGRLYFTFRLGPIWGVVLDCGEDKPDDHPEYGGMAHFDPYRAAQTRFLRRIAAEPEREYAAPGVRYRIAVSHVRPDLYSDEYFARHYREWVSLLNGMGIDLMLCGHEHKRGFLPAGRETPLGRILYPVVLGGAYTTAADAEGRRVRLNSEGTALTFRGGKIKVEFTDESRRVLESFEI
ncbi:MAG: metallophosphoesterase, partial [Clostridia bacterium]|nr:metallophosphoesterase [Clostridia bacterium]